MRLGASQIVGLLLLVIGIAFLLRNAGVVDIDWAALGPLLLVVLGVVVLLGATGVGVRGDADVRLPRGPGELELDLTAGAGRFRLSGGAESLVEVSSSDADVRWMADRRGQRARVRLRQGGGWSRWRWGRGAGWEIRVAADVPTALDLTVGAGELDVDLVDVRLVGGRVSLGAASGSIRLPRPVGEVRLDVTLGAASLRIGIPAGVEARVTPSGGLLSVSGQRETAGWASATDRVAVAVSGGASSVRVVAA